MKKLIASFILITAASLCFQAKAEMVEWEIPTNSAWSAWQWIRYPQEIMQNEHIKNTLANNGYILLDCQPATLYHGTKGKNFWILIPVILGRDLGYGYSIGPFERTLIITPSKKNGNQGGFILWDVFNDIQIRQLIADPLN